MVMLLCYDKKNYHKLNQNMVGFFARSTFLSFVLNKQNKLHLEEQTYRVSISRK